MVIGMKIFINIGFYTGTKDIPGYQINKKFNSSEINCICIIAQNS